MSIRSLRARLRTLQEEKTGPEHQVADDSGLLAEMMDALSGADTLYRPTNYWSYYEKSFVPELQRSGLNNFRRRRRSVLGSFSAVDEPLSGRLVLPWSDSGTTALNALLAKMHPFVKVEPQPSPEKIIDYFHRHVAAKFERVAWNLQRCAANRIGNPEVVEFGGQLWSLDHLQFCSMLADAAAEIPFSESSTVCELGPGMGRNIEILAHLFPRATLLMFDIPPQLYVSNQYLSKVFGSRVIGYRDAIRLQPVRGQLPPDVVGRIVVLPTWKMPEWSSTPIDVFWNSASFQEMEPDVVANYLGLVKRMGAKWIYINAQPTGNYAQEWKPGQGGTKVPVVDAYYFEALQPAYRLARSYRTDYLPHVPQEYRSYIFSRGHDDAT